MVTEAELDRLEKLERYYNHFEVEKRYGITFKRFVEMVDRGTWAELVG